MAVRSKYQRDQFNRDTLGWDVGNWRVALELFDDALPSLPEDAVGLELACGHNGGLSLWMASRGLRVICSGYPVITESARRTHARYDSRPAIAYARVDARKIPMRGTLDVVAFKSMLGGIVRAGSTDLAVHVLREVRDSLRPGGWLLMAENLCSTRWHAMLRRRFASGKDAWRYFALDELVGMLGDFDLVGIRTFGFVGALGRREWQRTMLAHADRLLTRVLPATMHYAVAVVARKPE